MISPEPPAPPPPETATTHGASPSPVFAQSKSSGAVPVLIGGVVVLIALAAVAFVFRDRLLHFIPANLLGSKPAAGAPPSDSVSQETFCGSYADSAVVESQASQQNACGFSGDGWSTDRQTHLQHCMKADRVAVMAEEKARETQLADCMAKAQGTQQNQGAAAPAEAGGTPESGQAPPTENAMQNGATGNGEPQNDQSAQGAAPEQNGSAPHYGNSGSGSYQSGGQPDYGRGPAYNGGGSRHYSNGGHEIRRSEQQLAYDDYGRVLRHAATVHVIECYSGRQMNIFEYHDIPGYRVIERGRDWHSGRSARTFREAMHYACME